MKLPPLTLRRPSRRTWWYLAIGVVCYLLFLLAGFPAQLAYRSFIQPVTGNVVQLEGISGSLWHGSAAQARVANIQLGRLEWDVHAWKLLFGRFTGDVSFRSGDAHGKTVVSTTLSGKLRLSETILQMPAQNLMALAYGLPVALDGDVALEIKEAVIVPGETLQVDGRLNWINAAVVAPQSLPLGNISLQSVVKDEGSEAALTQVEGNLFAIDGQLQVKGSGQYKVSATVAVKDPTREDLKSALYLIGRPRPDGAAQILLTGQLPGW